MKLTHIRWLLIGVLAFLFILNIVVPTEPVTLGLTEQWSNGSYRFAGGTEPEALATATLLIGLYLLLMHAIPTAQGQPLPGVFRRFVAFWCDFIFAMLVIGPILGLLPTLIEWKRTGVFEWAFERNTPASSDGLLSGLGLVLGFAALLFYYALPLVRRRPSPGACILGYQIVSEDGTALTMDKALLRTLLGFIAVSSACVAPFVGRDRKNGKFWLDKVLATRAVLLS